MLPTKESKNSLAGTVIAGKKTFIANRRINSLNSWHELLTGRKANHHYQAPRDAR